MPSSKRLTVERHRGKTLSGVEFSIDFSGEVRVETGDDGHTHVIIDMPEENLVNDTIDVQLRDANRARVVDAVGAAAAEGAPTKDEPDEKPAPKKSAAKKKSTAKKKTAARKTRAPRKKE